MTRRSLFPSEVIQSSPMDCGPAVVKSACGGFGIPLDYAQLRDACQTDVDGTSIDQLEDLFNTLGVEATQLVLPLDHLIWGLDHHLPAVVVVKQADGSPHFVLAWRSHFGRVHVMDPARGGVLMDPRQLADWAFFHRQGVSKELLDAYTRQDAFTDPIRSRLRQLGLQRTHAERVLQHAVDSAAPDAVVELDATTRFVSHLHDCGRLNRGTECRAAVARLTSANHDDDRVLPGAFYFAHEDTAAAVDERFQIQGAVVLQLGAARPTGELVASGDELREKLRDRSPHPLRTLAGLLLSDPWPILAAVLSVLALTGALRLTEALVLRGLLDGAYATGAGPDRWLRFLFLVGFFVFLALVEYPTISGLLGIGRRLELRFRLALSRKLIRLSDRYFRTRPSPDLAERAHLVHHLRDLPGVGGAIASSVAELALTAGGIVWLVPELWSVTLATACASVVTPVLIARLLRDPAMRVRTLSGALVGHFADALRGIVPMKSHGAERTLVSTHAAQLVEWARATLRLVRAQAVLEGLAATVVWGLAIAVIFRSLQFETASAGTAVLLVYWTLGMPKIGNRLSELVARYPFFRSVVHRVQEPLSATDEDGGLGDGAPAADTMLPRGVAIDVRDVAVVAGGQTLLEGVDVEIRAGSHVAVVGPSGAGKSTLAGLLLGFHEPHAGALLVDGQPAVGNVLARLREQTAWIDPNVQLWNSSIYENLIYGAETKQRDLGKVAQLTDLVDVIERLPGGLQSLAGESGSMLSGGEGQRVRVARAMARPSPRLVILDEPFRGLERERRRRLLLRAREIWRSATLICITHDVEDTLDFDRVLLIDGGRVVDDGDPRALLGRADSPYRGLVGSERAAKRYGWFGDSWRHVELQEGRLVQP